MGSRILSCVTALLMATWGRPLGATIPEDPQGALPPPDFRMSTTTFPSGGVILGTLSCPGCDEKPLFSDALGNEVLGTFLTLPVGSLLGNVAFFPNDPLVPGSYTAMYASSFHVSTVAFSVVEASSELPVFAERVVARYTGYGEPLRCVTYGADAEERDDYFVQSQDEFFLSLGVEGINSSQYSYLISVEGGDAYPAFYNAGEQASLGTEVKESCFEVFATPILDGPEISLGEGCVDTRDVAGSIPYDQPWGYLDRMLLECTVPPEGYQHEWCNAFALQFGLNSCDSAPVEQACIAARVECENGDLEVDSSGALIERSVEKSSARNSERSGCSVGPVLAAQRSHALIFSLLVTLLIGVRRPGRAR